MWIGTEQVKKYGPTRTAIEETLRICRDKTILTEYLKQRETEIMDIMTTLFDQDYITELYGYEREQKGRNEGFLEATVNAIRNLMQSLRISCSKAMELLMIPKNEQDTYLQALAEAKSKQD